MISALNELAIDSQPLSTGFIRPEAFNSVLDHVLTTSDDHLGQLDVGIIRNALDATFSALRHCLMLPMARRRREGKSC